MAHIGYIRVNEIADEMDQQLKGVALNKIFEDHAGGSGARPALEKCLASLEQGNVLHVESLDRPAKNLTEVRKLIADCTAKGAELHFRKEGLVFTPYGNAASTDIQATRLHMLDAVLEFERSLLRERQHEGRAAARKEGQLLGRPRSITPEIEDLVWARLRAGKSAADVAKEFGVARSSVYNIRRKRVSGDA